MWTDATHGWAAARGDPELFATRNGGRTWSGPIFSGGNYLFDVVRTSRSNAVVETGNWVGSSLWTNDGGSHWFLTDAFPKPNYNRGALAVRRAGRGSLLFWHQYGNTLYRVKGWPPRGVFRCTRSPDWPNELPNHPICEKPAGDAGLSSAVVARLERGRFESMAAVPGGVIAVVTGHNDRAVAPQVAGFRNGSLSLVVLPEPLLDQGDALSYVTVTAARPRLYSTADVTRGGQSGFGEVLWRSEDGGATWTVALGKAKSPSVLHRPAPPSRARRWFPGGFVAVANARGRRVLLINRLGRTRVLALPGADACSSMSILFDANLGSFPKQWPQLFVEGRRAGRTVAVWWSQDAGRLLWTKFGEC